MSVVFFVVLMAVVLPLPTWVAFFRRVSNAWRIALVNALLVTPFFITLPHQEVHHFVIGSCALLWIALLAYSFWKK